MTIDTFRAYCLAKPGAAEDVPFGPDVLCFKVGGKLFALMSLDAIPPRVNLKCDPEQAAELRERYEAVVPGYHMNKRHWNSVTLDGSVPSSELESWVDHSHTLVAQSLPKKIRAELGI